MNIKVRVKSGEKNESIRKNPKGFFDISVREKPLQNQANTRVIQLIAAHFGVSRKKVRMTSGRHRPTKMIRIDG